jgi:hypothetical protein
LQVNSLNTLRRTTVCSLTSLIEVKYQSDFGLAGARFVLFNLSFLVYEDYLFIDGVEILYHRLGQTLQQKQIKW